MMRALVVLLAAGCDVFADGTLSIDIHVDSIEPRSVPTSGAALLTIVGTNFDDGVVVTFDGVPAIAVVRTSDHLLTVVPPGRPRGASDLVIANPDGRSLAVPAAVRYYASTIGFAAGTNFYRVPRIGPPVFGGDFDGDGIGDAVAISYDGELVAWSLDGLGVPTIGAMASGQSGYDLGEVLALTDFDGDGDADVVGRSGIIPTKPGPAFSPFARYPEPWGQWPTAALAADFDGDGTLEIAAMRPEGMAILEYAGAAFSARPVMSDPDHRGRSTDFFESTEPPVAADFDGDGDADLAFTGEDGRIRVAQGPDLAAVILLDAIAAPSPINGSVAGVLAAIDVDVDGRVDLVAAESARTLVYRGGLGGIATTPLVWPALCGESESLVGISSPASDRVFAPLAVRCSTTTRAYVANVTRFSPTIVLDTESDELTTVADLDHDGQLDVIETATDESFARYAGGRGLLGYGSVRLEHTESPTAITLGMRVVAGRFHGGKFAIANGNGVAVVADPTVRDAITSRAELGEDRSAIEDLAACDLDGDGFDDLVAVFDAVSIAPGEAAYQVRTIGVGDDGFVLGPVLAETSRPRHRLFAHPSGTGCEVVWAIVDQQGRLDGPFDVFRFDPSGMTHGTLSVAFPEPSSGLQLASYRAIDIDGDGDLDLYSPLTQRPDTTFGPSLLRRDRSGFVASSPPSIAGMSGGSLDNADFSLERLDDGNSLLWSYSGNGVEFSLVVATLDRDGRADVLASVPMPMVGGARGVQIALGDVDGDGASDAVIAPGRFGSGSRVVVVTRPGGRGAQLAATLDLTNPTGETIESWYDARLIDVNGDGLSDLVFTANNYDDRVGVVLNDSR